MTPHQIEALVRAEFNKANSTSAKKQTLSLGSTASHEFDLFENGKIIGGISTSPWFNRSSGSNNTGGQDRAATELLWLTLWPGDEKRVHVLTDKEMTDRLLKRFSGAGFPKRIEIHYFDVVATKFSTAGVL